MNTIQKYRYDETAEPALDTLLVTHRKKYDKSILINSLKSMSLFSSLSRNDLESLLLYSVVTKYPREKMLFLTGDKADFFYIMIEGWIKLYRETRDGHESIIKVLTKGETFGQMAIWKDGVFEDTAELGKLSYK